MMTAGTTLFKSLQQPRFTGQFIFKDADDESWIFHFYMGRIIYVNGGIHAIRRWVRNLSAYCPQLTDPLEEAQKLLRSAEVPSAAMGWQYQVLCQWAIQRKITREQVQRLIRGMVVEALFDVLQARCINYRTQADNSLPTQLAALEVDQVVSETEELWQGWQTARLADYSPNAAPVIRHPAQLQETAGNVYQILSKLLDGQRTLRDIAIQMKRNVVDVTRSLLPYVQLGLVELTSITDLPAPVVKSGLTSLSTTSSIPIQPSGGGSDSRENAALIACIDDSPIICQSMQKVITGANYRFLGISDPLRAIATLLSQKPDMVFLDLIMPNANGYEICSQLRKLSIFKETPIVILTGQDGIIDRVRAKLVGATDFLSKPVAASTVLEVINRYLNAGILLDDLEN